MAQALSYTLKLSAAGKAEGVSVAMVTATGMPKFETLEASHPTFNALVRALKRKEWVRVPKLISIAQRIADQSQGSVEVTKDGIFYKGVLIDNSLTKRMIQMLKEGKSIKHMLRFMDNLFQNPEKFAIHELYDWLNGCNLPISDRGTFFAYKRVRSDYKDCYTGTIDNSVGQIVFMKRSDVCKDRQQTCERGLHFCSIAYLPQYPGDKIMQVEINPRDVVSIPVDYDYSKGRTWMYEVVAEIPQMQLTALLDQRIDIEEFQTSVYSIAKDRRKLLADILALPTIKSMIRFQKRLKSRAKKAVKRGRKAKTEKFVLSEQSIRKMTYGRLVKLYKQFAPPEPPKMSAASENRLEAIRKGYGFSRGEVAAQMRVKYAHVYDLERAKAVSQEMIDKFIGALIALAKLGATYQTGIGFPKLSQARLFHYTPVVPVLAGADDETDDEFGYEVEDED